MTLSTAAAQSDSERDNTPAPASKRRVDDVIAGLQSAKKRRVCSELQKLRQSARFLPCVCSPFLALDWVIPVGMTIPPNEESMDGDEDEHGMSFEDRRKTRNMYDKVMKYLPGLQEDLSEYKENADAFDNLIDVLKKAANQGRADNISSAKDHVLEHIPVFVTDLEDHRCIKSNTDKVDRGWVHLQTARQLCPVERLAEFDDDPMKFCRAARRPDSNIVAEDLPLCIYDEAQYDPEDCQKGLLMGGLVLEVGRCILTGPRSAGKSTAGPRGGGQRPVIKKHGDRVQRMTPEMIAYIACLTRFSISDEHEWSGTDRAFNYATFHSTIVELLSDPTDPWCTNTLNFWNYWIFETPDPTSTNMPINGGHPQHKTTADKIRERRVARSQTADADPAPGEAGNA